MLKIEIVSSPAHVCIEKAHHGDLFRSAFVGMRFIASINPEDETVYLVTIQEVLVGLMRKHGLLSLVGIYWQMRWSHHRLYEHVRFPRDCCVVIED